MVQTRIGICAPSTPITRDDAARVIALAGKSHPQASLVFHDQCFASADHFAGSDDDRRAAFVELANDPAIDAIWFVRGGYGACRIAEEAVERLAPAASAKRYLGYSDAGTMLAALYRAGIGTLAHGPMPVDIRREGGEAAVRRALDWLTRGEACAYELSLEPGQRYAAFNLMTLTMLLGTRIAPDLADHVLMIEEVGEYDYAFDRAFFHLADSLKGRGLAGLRLGRISNVTANDRPFGATSEEIARYWCDHADIPYLGRADIGHDVANKIVPFGAFAGRL